MKRIFLSVLLALACSERPAGAEVRELADRLSEAWKAIGARIVRLPPRFVYEDETVILPLPALGGRCLTVAIVGPRGLSFHARTGGGAEDDPLDDSIERSSSVAGAAELSRCESGDFSRLRVTSDAGRGAIEIVVAASDKPLSALRTVLPERAGSLPPPMLEPGGSPPVAPAEKRADAAELRARTERAQQVLRETWTGGDDGSASQPVALTAGCHRFELFGSEARKDARKRLDVDAELRDDGSDAMLARDRSEAADARLEACVGEPIDAHVVFGGAGAGGSVLVVHASWPIPDKLPWAWGPLGRARMAEALIARHVLAPQSPAVLLAQGVRAEGALAGPISASIEPGGCYVAVAAIVQGIPRGIGLRASLGAREITDDRGPSDASALVAFCAQGRDRVRLEVDARGAPGTSWGLALFRVASGMWEAR
jgi:hypothetical protein